MLYNDLQDPTCISPSSAQDACACELFYWDSQPLLKDTHYYLLQIKKPRPRATSPRTLRKSRCWNSSVRAPTAGPDRSQATSRGLQGRHSLCTDTNPPARGATSSVREKLWWTITLYSSSTLPLTLMVTLMPFHVKTFQRVDVMC